jgi:hypothetical protein
LDFGWMAEQLGSQKGFPRSAIVRSDISFADLGIGRSIAANAPSLIPTFSPDSRATSGEGTRLPTPHKR